MTPGRLCSSVTDVLSAPGRVERRASSRVRSLAPAPCESATEHRTCTGLRAEIAVVLGLLVLVAVELLVTYARLPASELYHVSRSGLRGGLGRVLVFSNFPASAHLLANLGLPVSGARAVGGAGDGGARGRPVLRRLLAGHRRAGRPGCKTVNALAGIGIALTIALAAAVFARNGLTPFRREPGDAARVVVGLVLVLASIPWMAADLGFFLDGAPVLGRLFQTGHAAHQLPGDPAALPAVHHGHHHGMDGLLLALSALLLSRALRLARTPLVRALVSSYLALMFCLRRGEHAERLLGRAGREARLDRIGRFPTCSSRERQRRGA